MKYTWLEEERNPQQLVDTIGCPVKSVTKGNIIVGYEDGFDEEGKPAQVPILKRGVEIEFDIEPTQGQLAKLDAIFGQAKREGVPPRSLHIAALTAVDVPSKKATVVRKWMGQNYTYTGCYVSLQTLEAYQAGKIKLYNNAYGINAPENADSFVLVYFVSENPYDDAIEIPVIVDKLVK